jgi:hypothetical protein
MLESEFLFVCVWMLHCFCLMLRSKLFSSLRSRLSFKDGVSGFWASEPLSFPPPIHTVRCGNIPTLLICTVQIIVGQARVRPRCSVRAVASSAYLRILTNCLQRGLQTHTED